MNYFYICLLTYCLLCTSSQLSAMEEKDTFLQYIGKQKRKITALKAGLHIAFVNSFVESAFSKHIKNRGYDNFSQKIIRLGIDYLAEDTDYQFYHLLDEPTDDCIEYIQNGTEYIQNRLTHHNVEVSSKEGKNIIARSLYIHFLTSCCHNKNIRLTLKKEVDKELLYRKIENAELYLFLNMYIEFLTTKADMMENQ